MEDRFRSAVVISVVVHLLLITPLYSLDISHDPPQEKKPMTIDYVSVDETSAAELNNADTSTRIAESSRLELTKAMDIDKSPAPDKKLKAPEKKQPSDAAPAPLSAKSYAESAVVKKIEAPIKSTQEYVSYYQAIRERIRSKLKENYRYYYEGGDVTLVFILRADGTMAAYDVDRSRSSRDETLINIATASLIESAPFPRFPRALTLPKMSFSLAISFKKR